VLAEPVVSVGFAGLVDPDAPVEDAAFAIASARITSVGVVCAESVELAMAICFARSLSYSSAETPGAVVADVWTIFAAPPAEAFPVEAFPAAELSAMIIAGGFTGISATAAGMWEKAAV
jgi:hypothetical protein